MFRFGAVALLAGAVRALPQGIDWDAVENANPIPTPSIPVVNAAAAATTIPVNAAAAVASVSAAVMASPSDTSLKVRRDNTGCAVQPGPNDNPEAFLSNPAFQEAALTAQTPAGYELRYQNQTASSQGVMGYMGFSVLDSYSVPECQKRCEKARGCSSFNIYFERDPSVAPSNTCTNPASTTVIKCVYYGGSIKPETATNDGQFNKGFHIVIAGSNAYTSNSVKTPPGYTAPNFLGRSAINAPNDCNGKGTYMGVKIFDGNFDINKCAVACSAQSEYNRAHPAADGSFQTCQFFNTYILFNETTAVGQYCSLYSQSWPSSFATNNGQWRGPHYFGIDYSFSASNATDAGFPSGCQNPSRP